MSRVTEGGAPTELDVARAGQGTSGSARGEPRIVQVGDSVGRYRIEAKVGQGGHGAIYRGRDPALDRVVAIKLLRVADHPLARERLQREARALAQLEHPDVVRVFDVGEHDGAPFIAMEFLDGEDLAQAWKDWPLEARIDALIAAGRGLCATHRAGLVHRDFKPLNVLCCKDGRVVLVDFGLVRELDDVGSTPRVADPRFQTDPRAAIGTRGYMAPEQMVRPDVDARADQFAFAAALYEAAYGETAFGSDGMAQFDVIAMRRRARASHKTGAPRWLRAIIARGLDPDEAARFPDMDALVAALERGRGARRRRLRLAALAVAAGVVVGFGAVAHERSDAAAPREPSVDTANDERAEAERLDRQLAIIDADQHGSLARRLAALDAALVQADSPLLRRALELRHAALLELADDRVGAREELQRLLDDARTAGDHRHTALAHVRLAQTSIDARELAAAELELRNGESAATRANMPVEWDAEVERAAGALAFAHGEYTASEREHWAALDLVQGTPRESAMTTMIGNALGAIAGNRGDFELAADYFVRARAATPDDDPKVPELELNLGGALLGLRREQEALASLRSALAAALRSAGPASRPAGQSACALAFALAQLDEPAECRARARECVAIGHAGNHGYLEIDGTVLAARCTLALDDAAEAERLAQHAIVLAEGSPSYARALAEAEVELGRARAALGRTPEARRAFARALVDARTALQARNAVSGMLALPR